METTQPLTKTIKTILIMLLIALLTAIGSEVKIMPFDNASFRFGLGSIIFFFALLVRPVPILSTGIITAITVITWRTVFNMLQNEHTTFVSFIEYVPAGLFYIVFAICIHVIPFENIKKRPFLLGLCGMSFEVIANTLEHIATAVLYAPQLNTSNSLLLFVFVGFLRSFFVVGLYSAISLSEQKKQLQHLMAIHSELYVEVLYIRKSMDQVEQLTVNSYQLYKKLKAIDSTLGKEALLISQEMHEIKKDHERIYAGLAKITNTEFKDAFLLSDLLNYIVEANENYAQLQQKTIQFKTICPNDFKTNEHIALLAILNNLMANAVEAIEHQGIITLTVKIHSNTTEFIVEDNGIGIDMHLLPVIFDVGYTSKFNTLGYASTGIGLSHTKTIIENLQGSITVTSDQLTRFTVRIPTNLLREEEN
ncbi:histidine kinase [Solibacillus sp. R5-41]|uniref:ATP-binding protein n=1 Tax=Solibacillus sp. R5-41 TaxID=2048654 RepID=UPI000C12827C|nr:ATP-binding protein [Solibacillus sp. R5-41]ATP38584.1 histidine kinase [Solibacillus sp. R5-41]